MPKLQPAFISYCQIAVFQYGLVSPFNDWSDPHVNQGFSWRPESVSFKTLMREGNAEVSYSLASEISINPDAMRSIQVPFYINEGGKVEIATISDSQELSLNTGRYALMFETGLSVENVMWCNFVFVIDGPNFPLILKSDSDIHIPNEYTMDANPA